MSVGYRTMSMAEMSTILRNLQRSLESLQSQVNSLSGGGGGGTGGGATSHNLLSITHSDTETDTVVQGDLIVGGSTPTWERLALGASGTFLKSDGSDPNWATLEASDIDALALLLDQTTPQTIVNGIPLLDKEYDDFSEPKQFVNKGYVDWIATAIGANYYMTDDTDGDTGYKVCSLTPSAGSETYIEESGVVDDQLLGTWISDVGEAPAKLPRGMYDWFIFAEKTSGTKTLRLYWKLYERKTDDSEVLVATSSESNELKMGEKTGYVVPLALDSDYTPDSGSRIVGKIYASVSGSGNDPTVKIYYQGASGSRWEIPSSVEILSGIFVKQDSSPTFAELTLDGALIGKEITTPSNPSAGYNKLYCKSDDKWYTLDSEGNEVELGSGGGGASEFLDLTDTPSSYVGQAGMFLKVNSAEDSLEFATRDVYTGNIFKDEFDDASLFWAWRRHNTDANRTISESGGTLNISVNSGTNADFTSSTNNAPKAIIGLPGFPCEIVAKLTFTPNDDTMAGLVFSSNLTSATSNYCYVSRIRNDSGSQNGVTAYIGTHNYIAETASTIWFKVRISSQPPGSVWSFFYSTDGVNWTELATEIDPISSWDGQVGLTGRNWGVYNEVNASFEYFMATQVVSPGDGSVSVEFLDLTDTPSSYSGQAGKYLKVNATEDALEYISHDKALHDALGIDADTVDGKHASDFLEKIDVGIDDDDILQVDQATGLTAGNLVRATSSGLESRTDAEILV